MLWLELLIVLLSLTLAVYVGGKRIRTGRQSEDAGRETVGGLGIGASCALGVLILVFGFHAPVASPPVDVIFIILPIVGAAATLEAVGGLDVLVRWAEWALQLYPGAVTFVAPLVAFFLTVLVGTSHGVYAIMPVIKRVAEWARVPVQRPLSIAVVASQIGITASPVSAATAGMVALLSSHNSRLGLADILIVCIPAGICGCLFGALAVCARGERPGYALPMGMPSQARFPHAAKGVAIFLGAVGFIALSGMIPALRPALPGGVHRLAMTSTIQMVMLSVVVITLFACQFKLTPIGDTVIMRAGVQAVFSILGVAWLGSCFIEANRGQLLPALSSVVTLYPWAFPLSLLVLSAVMYSQAATVAALMTIGFTLNIPHIWLLAAFPAANGNFFLPTSPSIVAALKLDDTGSTRGGWPNHSFMLPGFVATTGTVLTAHLIIKLFYN